ncbi:MAG: toll/interleukin-1 receptor domain-containing protein [Bacteroidota bacterium]
MFWSKPLKIFISYHRSDTQYPSDRLYQDLTAHYGPKRVFQDIPSIVPGADFMHKLEQEIQFCGVFIALIGENWISRVNDPEDMVRKELEIAIANDKHIIPLLTDGAKMPKEGELPASLKGFGYRNALLLRSGGDFSADLNKLVSAINAVNEQQTRSRYRTEILGTIFLAISEGALPGVMIGYIIGMLLESTSVSDFAGNYIYLLMMFGPGLFIGFSKGLLLRSSEKALGGSRYRLDLFSFISALIYAIVTGALGATFWLQATFSFDLPFVLEAVGWIALWSAAGYAHGRLLLAVNSNIRPKHFEGVMFGFIVAAIVSPLSGISFNVLFSGEYSFVSSMTWTFALLLPIVQGTFLWQFARVELERIT